MAGLTHAATAQVSQSIKCTCTRRTHEFAPVSSACQTHSVELLPETLRLLLALPLGPALIPLRLGEGPGEALHLGAQLLHIPLQVGHLALPLGPAALELQPQLVLALLQILGGNTRIIHHI